MGCNVEALGVKVCAEEPFSSREPLPAVRAVREEKSTVAAPTCSRDAPKSSPPPVMDSVPVTLCTNPEFDNFRVPEEIVRVGVTNP